MKRYVLFVILLLGTAILILWSGLRLPTEFALLVLVFAVALDFLTTWACLKFRGKEGNPIVGFLFKKIGIFWSFGLLAGVWTVFIMFRWIPQSQGIQTAVAIAYLWVPVNNLIVLRRLRRKVAQ